MKPHKLSTTYKIGLVGMVERFTVGGANRSFSKRVVKDQNFVTKIPYKCVICSKSVKSGEPHRHNLKHPPRRKAVGGSH